MRKHADPGRHDAMLLLTTAALPQLERHHHPNLGRLITPRRHCRLADTLAALALAGAAARRRLARAGQPPQLRLIR